MDEYVQPEGEIRQEEPMEKMPTEAPEAPAVSEERTDKGKGKAREEEVEDFVSVTHPHPLLSSGVPGTPQKSPAVTSND